jgi:glycosyltransferase involved in cell wall biosynthesis
VKPSGSSPQKQRVALITGGLALGGATTFLCNLAGELVRRQIPVQVFSFERENPLAADFHSLTVPIVTPDDSCFIFEDRLEAILLELVRFRPTVVIANLSPVSFEVLRYVPPGVFRLGVAHADHPSVYNTVKQYARWQDALAVVSTALKQNFDTIAEFKNVPIHYLPLGVPMPEPVERTFSSPLRILYLGRVDRAQKRAHLYPGILKQLQEAGVPFHWTIAGDGSEKARLENIMESRPGQTVSFPGTVPYSDVPRLLQQHDIFLLASDYEGLPLSLIEAMGQGLVPVVSDLPSGIREVMDGSTGKLVPPDRTELYAEAILWLHEHRDELKRFSMQSQERVRNRFSTTAMADRWLAAFPAPPAPGSWPEKWNIRPPLGAEGQFRFSAAGRLARRVLSRLK